MHLERASDPYIRLLLGPRIIRLYLYPIEQCTFLPFLPEKCPEIRTLHLPGSSEGRDGTWQVVSSCVRGLTKLKDLTVDALDQQALKHVAGFPTLESLCLTKAKGEVSQWQYHKLRPFPALRRVSFTSTTIEFATEFTNSLSDHEISTLIMGVEDLAPSTSSAILYAALADHCSHRSLSDLNILSEPIAPLISPDASDMSRYVIRLDHLRPLFRFNNLTNVTLEPPVGFDIDDATASDMAHAWPCIKYLALRAGTKLQHPPRTTLNALTAFALHCPRLRSLSIALDASTVPPPDLIKPRPPLQTALASLNVGYSPIASATDVALFISRVFAGVTRVRTTIWNKEIVGEVEDEDPDARVHHEYWKAVHYLLPMANTARTEERQWTQPT